MLRKVVLPEPEGPVTARNSPALTLSEKCRSACVSMRSVRKTLLTFFISSMGVSFGWPESVGNQDAVGVLVITHVGKHDDVAGREPVAHFDLADGGGTELHRGAYRVVAAHHVDEAGLGIRERAAADAQHVVALVEHDAHRGALVLAQALRL